MYFFIVPKFISNTSPSRQTRESYLLKNVRGAQHVKNQNLNDAQRLNNNNIKRWSQQTENNTQKK